MTWIKLQKCLQVLSSLETAKHNQSLSYPKVLSILFVYMSRKLQVFELCGNEYEYLYAKQFYGLILYFHRRQSKMEEIGSDGGFFNVRSFFLLVNMDL